MRAGALVGDLGDDGLERERLLGQPEGAAGDGRDQRDLVAVGELPLALGVLAVDGVEQARRLVAEPERGPHVGDASRPSSSRSDQPARSRRPAKRRTRITA